MTKTSSALLTTSPSPSLVPEAVLLVNHVTTTESQMLVEHL